MAGLFVARYDTGRKSDHQRTQLDLCLPHVEKINNISMFKFCERNVKINSF